MPALRSSNQSEATADTEIGFGVEKLGESKGVMTWFFIAFSLGPAAPSADCLDYSG